jgi:hypothetical protein
LSTEEDSRMELTILRLPNIDVVLNRDNSVEEEEEEDQQMHQKQEVTLRRSTRPKQELKLRRSTRHRNQGGEYKEEKLEQENNGSEKRPRMRCNSVMDEDEEEELEDQKEHKRKEPDHRRRNQMCQQSVSSHWQ